MIATHRPIPGIHKGVPFAEYKRWPLMSQSVLKAGTVSMKRLKHALDGQAGFKPTDDMLLGSALHTAFLEPDELGERVALWSGPARRGKEWKAFAADNAHKIILTTGYHCALVQMVEALREHPKVSEWVGRTEAVEVSCVGEIDGVPFKSRVDAITSDPLWDLKKTTSLEDHAINNTIRNFGYHIQGYCYRRLFNRDRFCLAFVEDSPPYDVRVVELSPAWLKIGEIETHHQLARYTWCVRNGRFPGVSDEVDVMEPPTYLTDLYSEAADEVTFGGERAFSKE